MDRSTDIAKATDMENHDSDDNRTINNNNNKKLFLKSFGVDYAYDFRLLFILMR